MKSQNYLTKIYLLIFCILIVSMNNSFAQQTKNFPSLKSSGYAPVNGLKIYYEVHGTGDPIVLLHGAYMTIDMNWAAVIPELSKTRKVIVLELQGHGRTADINRPFSYNALANDVAGVMKHLKIESADVLGYSFGGTVAYALAIQNPELVKKLIIVSSVYKYNGWIPELRSMLASFQPNFFDQTPLMPAYKSIAPDTAYWHKFVAKMIEFDKQDYDLGDQKVKAIKSPVLLVMGDNDGVDLNHTATAYRLLGGGVSGDVAGLPKSQLAIIPGKTHVGLMMEPTAVMSVVTNFLNTK
jgi:pimeloyl-ACP methyl ester carboxylesterase